MRPRSRSELTLDVTVRLHGIPVTSQVCILREGLRLGEHPEAAVAFPGADLVVHRRGRRLILRERPLTAGEGITMDLGPVRVRMVVGRSRSLREAPAWTPDLRVLLATAAVALTVAAWDAAVHVVTDSPVAAAARHRLLDREAVTSAARVAPEPSSHLEIPAPIPPLDPLDHDRPPVSYLSLTPAPEPIPD